MIISLIGLFLAGLLIFYFEFTENLEQFVLILIICILLGLGAYFCFKNYTKVPLHKNDTTPWMLSCMALG
jgi:hypothetical protein